jgi:hypothetical protein
MPDANVRESRGQARGRAWKAVEKLAKVRPS